MDDETDICTKCGDEKVISEFGKDAYAKHGRKSQCKICARLYYQTNKVQITLKAKVYRDECRAEIALRQRQYYKDNKETVKKRGKKYYDANKDKMAKWGAQYRAANKVAITLKGKRYAKANPHKVNANGAKYRSSKLQATPGWYEHERIILLYKRAQDMTAMGIPSHVDHIYPLTSNWVCGLHCIDNLQLLSPSENIRKSNNNLTTI